MEMWVLCGFGWLGSFCVFVLGGFFFNSKNSKHAPHPPKKNPQNLKRGLEENVVYWLLPHLHHQEYFFSGLSLLKY